VRLELSQRENIRRFRAGKVLSLAPLLALGLATLYYISADRRSAMISTKTAATIPPIDLAAPVNTQTATFALG